MLGKRYNWQLISQYRSELMGIGIIGVMISHFLRWNEIQGAVAYIFKPFIGLVYTEGFLLLSGLGLYYSYKRDNNLKSFYIKRINRLLIPFLIIAVPFYVARGLVFHHSLGLILLNISSLRFWFVGNDGMWYISVSLLLYLIFPLLYKIIFGYKSNVFQRGILVIAFFYAIGLSAYYFFPSYYNLTGIGLTQMPMFVVGMMVGYLSYNCIQNKYDILFIMLLGLLAVISNMIEGVWGDYGNGLLRFFCIIILGPLFMMADKFDSKIFVSFKNLLQWFGKYTLELYILHMFIYKICNDIELNPCLGGAMSIVLSICVAPIIHMIINSLVKKMSIN